MAPSGSTHSLSSGIALPDDIRLKCSYYASEVQNQVSSLYDEQHKWLEDHLIKIKDTMIKTTHKNAGTRSVIAGIIKTPSCKRNKKLSKQSSKLDQLPGSDPFTSSNPSYPLFELKRSQLNINGIEIQEIIQQQLERERNEIELRLQQEISSLNNQYESPVKKSNNVSTLISADRGNQSTMSLWKPIAQPPSTTAISSLFGPNSTDTHPSLLPALEPRQIGHIEPIGKPHDSQQNAENQASPVQEPPLILKTSSLTAEEMDANDAFANAGHELSAIQEGEEEDDHNAAPLIPGPSAPHKFLTSPIPPSKPLEASHSTSSPSNKIIAAPLPQSKIDMPPAKDQANTSSQPQTHLISVETTSLHPKDYATSNQPSQAPALSLDSSEAPETNSTDAGVSNYDPNAPQILRSSEPPLSNSSPVVTSHVETEPKTIISDSHADTSHLVNASLSHMNPITYPFALLPSAVIAPVSEVSYNTAIRPFTSENRTVDRMAPGSSTLDDVQLSVTRDKIPSSNFIATVSPVKQELEENLPQSQLDDAARSTFTSQAHIDTTVEVPLNDNPSSLRHNLSSSTGSSHSERTTDHEARTPGDPKTNNLFTPGNTRATVIQSPHSKWSSKPSGTFWTQHKPLKTPAANSNLAPVGQHERQRSGLSGSPIEDLSKPFSLLSNLQSTTVQPDLLFDAPLASSLTQPISLIDSQDSRRPGLKRSSTDAGFIYAPDSQDAKMSRSHTPGMMNIRSSTTGGGGRKGMEDLKSRLSKIQRESAMHERVHHHAPPLVTDTSISLNQSLVAHNNPPAFMKTVPLPTPLPPLAPITKTLTLPNTRTIADDQQERDKAAEPRIHAQIIHHNFTAPIELLPSTKSQAAHPMTEQIHPHGHAVTSGPLELSSTMLAKPGSAPLPVVDQLSMQRRNSRSSSVNNIVAAFETRKKSSGTEVPMNAPATHELSTILQPPQSTTPLQPTAKVETKHLAFLKGVSSTVNPPLTSSSIISDEQVKNTNAEAIESHSLHSSPLLENVAEGRGQTDTEADDPRHCETFTSNQLSESTGIIPENESGNVSNEDHETQSETGDQVDDDQNDDLSVEITSSHSTSHSNGNLNKKVHAELHSSDEEAFNQIPTSSTVLQPELVKTPRNFPTMPSSPVSTGLMSVFKAGAALATSWTTSKSKPELKSLQLAAAAAKKDQDERDRKAALKEERRAMAAEKKQAEEKSKAENEKKARIADVEKKKQEREEASKARTGLKTKVPLNNQASGNRQISTSEEAVKKRKMENDSSRFLEKKVKAPLQGELHTGTKLPSSTQKATASSYVPSRTAPNAPGSAIKPTAAKNPASSSMIKQSNQHHKVNPPSRPPSQASQYNGGIGGKNNTATSQLKSSQASQSQINTATTATSTTITKNNQKIIKGKIKKTIEKEEYIELPDIDSEYSDDDESEHERKEKALPDWAQSPALKEALANQRKVNPDDVFGGSIPPPRMEEIFRDRASKFRHRTSSANWTGPDGLTALEESEYAKRMGYHSKNKSLKK